MWLSMWNNWNSSNLLLGISNGPTILEGCVANSYKAKDTPTYDTKIPFLDKYAKQMEIHIQKETSTRMLLSVVDVII